VVARVADSVGNVGTAFATVFVDTTPPALSPLTSVVLRSPIGIPVGR